MFYIDWIIFFTYKNNNTKTVFIVLYNTDRLRETKGELFCQERGEKGVSKEVETT